MHRQVNWRFLAGISATVLILTAATTAQAADEATKAKCAAYAKHAVEQYQLMKSHPGCDSHLDALSWRDDYGYHYNGCLLYTSPSPRD